MRLIFFLIAFIIFAACTEDENSSKLEMSPINSPVTDSTNSTSNEEMLIRSISPNTAHLNLCFDTTCSRFNRIIYGARKSRTLDTTINIESSLAKIAIDLFFESEECNYSNTKILFNGNPVQGDFDEFGSFIANITSDSLDKTSQLEILYDSLSCGNIRETYKFVHTKKTGGYAAPEVEFTNYVHDLAVAYFRKYNFYMYVYPDFYRSTSIAKADTVNSKCYLKTVEDSLELNLEFERQDPSSTKYPAAWATIDTTTLANFMAGDTTAILKCALIYQNDNIPPEVSNPKYYYKTIIFQDYKKASMERAYWDKNNLNMEPSKDPNYLYYKIGDGPDSTFATPVGYTRIIVKTNIGNKPRYSLLMPSNRLDYLLSADEIYDDPSLSTAADSVQILLIYRYIVGVSVEEAKIYDIFKRKIYNSGNADSAAIEQIFEAVLDSSGRTLPNIFLFDAIRIPGYQATE